MYQEYFGLKEAGFSITPDPQYLYLSQRHREALAHLLYGAGSHGGFVVLTGEVGTGKTTICRALLEQLPENVDLALILNPGLNVTELLHAVCEEFGVHVPAEEASSKNLVGHLNHYLLEAHAAGRKPVLMIDEAQNLPVDVLEQIRLLTNLETPKQKLLQIFLVGQPELGDLLDYPHLRQLAQRVTARYHLTPLNRLETAEYIRHRLAVAGVDRPLFTPGAVKRIYKLSGGIPRVINILCDRSLLGVYARQGREANAGIVTQAHKELQGEQKNAQPSPWFGPVGWLSGSALLLLIAAVLVLRNEPILPFDITPGDSAPAVAQTEAAVEAKPVTDSTPAPTPDFTSEPPSAETSVAAAIIASEPLPPADTDAEEKWDPASFILPAQEAMAALLSRWGRELPADQTGNPCNYAASKALQCREGQGTWNNLRHYNRPALIKLKTENGQVEQALVVGIGPKRVTLAGPHGEQDVDQSLVDRLWYGSYLILWQAAPGNLALVRAGSPRDAVRWLREGLAALPESDIEDTGNGAYDAGVQSAVKTFQREQGLTADGIAGPETLIRLNTLARRSGVPTLEQLP